jgi:phosphoglycolate phosphatase
MATMPILLILFDLDGTLIDSVGDIAAAANHGLLSLGVRPVDAAETRDLVGEGPARLIEKLLLARGLAVDAEPLVRKTVEYYSSHLTVHTAPFPGVVETLESLGAFRKAVVSNKPGVLTDGVLRELQLTRHFDAVLGSDALPERKPSPAPILHLMKRFAVAPEETVIVGDSPIDIEAGRAAGVRTVAVTYGYGKPGFEREAHLAIDRFNDLADILNRM